MDRPLLGSSVRVLQERILEWVAISFSTPMVEKHRSAMIAHHWLGRRGEGDSIERGTRGDLPGRPVIRLLASNAEALPLLGTRWCYGTSIRKLVKIFKYTLRASPRRHCPARIHCSSQTVGSEETESHSGICSGFPAMS